MTNEERGTIKLTGTKENPFFLKKDEYCDKIKEESKQCNYPSLHSGLFYSLFLV